MPRYPADRVANRSNIANFHLSNKGWLRLERSESGLPIEQLLLVGTAINIISLLFSHATLDPVLSVRFIALSALSALLTSILLFRTAIAAAKTEITIITRVIFPIVLAYTIIAGFSLFQSVNLAEGIHEWLKLSVSFSFFFTATIILAQNENGIPLLAGAAALAGVVLAGIGICQYHQIAFTSIPCNDGICATMANQNLLASALFLILPFILYGALQFNGTRLVLSRISLLGVFYAMALSGSRAVWAAVALGAAAVILMLMRRYQGLRLGGTEKKFYLQRTRIVAAIFVLSCLAAVYTHSNDNYRRFHAHTASQPGEKDWKPPDVFQIPSVASMKGRERLWLQSLQMVRSAPIFGVGIGQWKVVAPAYSGNQITKINGAVLRQVRAQRPHNDFLWICSELGIVGIACHLLFLAVLFFYGLRALDGSDNMPTKLICLLILSGLVGFIVISFFSFPRERIFHNIAFMLMAAVIVSIYHRTYPTTGSGSRRLLTGINIVILSTLILALILGATRLESEIHAKHALRAYRHEKWREVIRETDQVDFRFYNLDPTATPLAWYSGIARLSLGHIEEACRDFQNAYMNNPYHAHVIYHVGKCGAFRPPPRKAPDSVPQLTALPVPTTPVQYDMAAYYPTRSRF